MWNQKLHAVVARGAKHISKSKCEKQTILGALLEVEMLQKLLALWRKAHVEIKLWKAHRVRATFGSWDVEEGHAAPLWREAQFEVNNIKNWRSPTTLNATLQYTRLQLPLKRQRQLQLQLHYNCNWTCNCMQIQRRLHYARLTTLH